MVFILSVHAVSTLMMAGVAWFVQLVHYPLMGIVGIGQFHEYEQQHVRRTTWIVAPLMVTELLSATALFAAAGRSSTRTLAACGLVLLAIIWASTAMLQVPCHRRLGNRFDAGTVRRLVATSWIRTVSWTLRAGIAVMVSFPAQGQGAPLAYAAQAANIGAAAVRRTRPEFPEVAPRGVAAHAAAAIGNSIHDGTRG